jgi:hypothetical protein
LTPSWLQMRSRNSEKTLVVCTDLLCLAVCVSLAKASPTAKHGPACESHQLASLDLEIPEGGAVLVPVTVDRTRLYMYLEIASPLTAVSEQAVARFAFQRTDIGKVLEITSGDKRVQQYATTSFQLGDITYSQEHLLIDPQSTSPRRYTRPDIIGVLGIDLLWKMDLELDLAHRKLNLYQPSKIPVSRGLLVKSVQRRLIATGRVR